MATTLKKTNVVIIGLGAAGGVACLPLAQAGIDVIGIEAGSRLSTKDMAPDELKLNRGLWPPGAQKVRGEGPTSRPNASAQAVRVNHPMMNAVGGTSVHYMAQSWRLNPYYDKVEYAIGVSGKAGNIGGKADERGNIFEGPRKREYPMPALRNSGYMDRMIAGARSLGWHPFVAPAAITSKAYEGRPGCAYHGYCIGAGCHINAKSSTAVTTIPKAEKTGHFTIVTEARVTTIEVDNNGRITGVNYVKGGQEYFQPADAVLMAGYIYENVRLLLLSKSKAYPNGLSNNHGQVGKHYFSHNQGAAVSALFQSSLNNWYGTPGQGIAVDNWADDNFDHSGL